MKRVRGLALFFVLVGCAKPAPPSPWEKLGVRVVDGVPQLGEVAIELERTGCYGFCPSYTVTLSGNGTIAYAGRMFVKTKGEHAASFDPQKLLPLLESFGDLDFLATKHACSVHVVDNSHAHVALRVSTRSNSTWDEVADDEGDTSAMPPDERLWHRQIYALEEAIDAAADIHAWIGTDEELRVNWREWR